MIDNVKLLKATFPQLPPAWYDVLSQMVKEEGFTDARLTDAVKHLIKTCVYPVPAVANILSFDRRLKLYTYSEMADQAIQYGSGVWDQYFKKIINGTVYWISKREADQYGFPY